MSCGEGGCGNNTERRKKKVEESPTAVTQQKVVYDTIPYHVYDTSYVQVEQTKTVYENAPQEEAQNYQPSYPVQQMSGGGYQGGGYGGGMESFNNGNVFAPTSSITDDHSHVDNSVHNNTTIIGDTSHHPAPAPAPNPDHPNPPPNPIQDNANPPPSGRKKNPDTKEAVKNTDLLASTAVRPGTKGQTTGTPVKSQVHGISASPKNMVRENITPAPKSDTRNTAGNLAYNRAGNRQNFANQQNGASYNSSQRNNSGEFRGNQNSGVSARSPNEAQPYSSGRTEAQNPNSPQAYVNPSDQQRMNQNSNSSGAYSRPNEQKTNGNSAAEYRPSRNSQNSGQNNPNGAYQAPGNRSMNGGRNAGYSSPQSRPQMQQQAPMQAPQPGRGRR